MSTEAASQAGLFEGFKLSMINTGEAVIRARHGGSGPPLLLLHGHPQTHLIWHRLAPLLAKDFTVVAADLRGYGDSSKPPTTPDHAPYSKRAMARDQVELMRQLGFDRFAVVGHDRGGRCAYRMALDHPERISRLAVLDVVPSSEALSRADMAFGMGYYHWFFLAQPQDLPERLIGADPEYYWRWHTRRGSTEFFHPEAVADYLRCYKNPQTIHAICEDYRAQVSIDLAHEQADRASGRRITCPMLALWGRRGSLDKWYDVPGIWREWADDVQGEAIDSSHYLPEEAPDEVYAALRRFLA